MSALRGHETGAPLTLLCACCGRLWPVGWAAILLLLLRSGRPCCVKAMVDWWSDVCVWHVFWNNTHSHEMWDLTCDADLWLSRREGDDVYCLWSSRIIWNIKNMSHDSIDIVHYITFTNIVFQNILLSEWLFVNDEEYCLNEVALSFSILIWFVR